MKGTSSLVNENVDASVDLQNNKNDSKIVTSIKK